MKLELRKFTKFVDKTFIEGGKEAKEQVLMVSVAAVFKNPWHIYFQQSTHHNNLQLPYLLLVYKLGFYYLYLFVTFIFAYV